MESNDARALMTGLLGMSAMMETEPTRYKDSSNTNRHTKDKATKKRRKANSKARKDRRKS